MLSPRKIGILAIVSPIWFAAVYLVMAGLRPEYSHLRKAISELGSVGAPRAAVWNLFGYIVPGSVVALLGLGVKRQLADDRRAALPSYALVVSGLLMAFSGVFPGDFEDRRSLTMLLHAVGSIGSFVAFLFAGFSLPRCFRARAKWSSLALPSLVLVWTSIVTGFLRSGSAPGLGQRLGFASFFLWVALVGYGLYRNAREAEHA